MNIPSKLNPKRSPLRLIGWQNSRRTRDPRRRRDIYRVCNKLHEQLVEQARPLVISLAQRFIQICQTMRYSGLSSCLEVIVLSPGRMQISRSRGNTSEREENQDKRNREASERRRTTRRTWRGIEIENVVWLRAAVFTVAIRAWRVAHGAWRTPRHLRQNQPPRHASFTASEKNVDVARRLATFRPPLSPTSDLSYLFWTEYFWNARSARLPRLVKVDHCCADSAYNCNDSCHDLPPVSFYGFAVCLRRVESPTYFLNPFLRFGAMLLLCSP